MSRYNMNEIDFKKEASKIIKIEITKQDLDYEKLAQRVRDMGSILLSNLVWNY